MIHLLLALCLARGSQAAGGSGAPSRPSSTGQNNPSQNGQQQQQQSQNTYNGPPNGIIYMPPVQTPNDYTPPDAAGLYRSDRYDPSPAFSSAATPSVLPSHPSTATVRAEGPPRPATIEDARESLPSLVATFTARRGKDGSFPLQGAGLVSLDKLDQNSVRPLGSGLFAASAVVRDAAGSEMEAEVTVDLSGNEWKVLQIAKPTVGASRDAAKCFADAVHARVLAGSRGRKGFVFHDEEIGRDWRLKLKRIHLERLQGFGLGRSFSCVDFEDLAQGRLVDLDFYVTRASAGCKVDGIVVHRVDGKARITKPLPAP
jgi:hypothetical protein